MFWKSSPAGSSTRAPKSGGTSVITDDMHILGNIVSDGMVDFNGTIDGNITCQMLTVRKHGIVKGEITADTVHIFGKVEGLIKAKHAHLHSGCHIEGTVMHESLTIEDGAFIDGKCKRTDKPLKDDSDTNEDSGKTPLKFMENIRLIR